MDRLMDRVAPETIAAAKRAAVVAKIEARVRRLTALVDHQLNILEELTQATGQMTQAAFNEEIEAFRRANETFQEEIGGEDNNEDKGLEVFVLTIRGLDETEISVHLSLQEAKDEIHDFEQPLILAEWEVCNPDLHRCTGDGVWGLYNITIARHLLT